MHYLHAMRLTITARDDGGNSLFVRLWNRELQRRQGPANDTSAEALPPARLLKMETSIILFLSHGLAEHPFIGLGLTGEDSDHII